LSKPAVAIRSEVSKENWIDDELYQNCLSCGSEFSRLNRRHHCRLCGLLVCNPCGPKRAFFVSQGPKQLVRVCCGCFNLLAE